MSLQASSRTAVVVAIFLSPSLVACTALDPGGPTPVPSAATVSPSESNQERQVRKDFQAAADVYRLATAEVDRLQMLGGADQATKRLMELTTGDYLSFYTDVLSALKSQKLRTTGPAVVVGVNPTGGWSAKRLVMTACEDASQVRLVDKDGKDRTPPGLSRAVQTLTFTKIDGKWKVSQAVTQMVKTFENQAGCSS